MESSAMQEQERRRFLCNFPLAVAAGISFIETLPSVAMGQAAPASDAPFELITSDRFHEECKARRSASGSTSLFKDPHFSITLTSPKNGVVSTEFELHEHTDHIFYVIEGSVVYELGGTLRNPRKTSEGEWLAPASEGARTVVLKKNDTLVIRRGTPHKLASAENLLRFACHIS